jgi:hypothetical protein
MTEDNGSVRVGEVLLGKEDLTKKVTTNRGIFVMKYPSPFERQALIRNISSALNFAPLESIPGSDYMFNKAIETLKIVVTEAPDWWRGADQCMDEQFIMDLYEEYLKFEKDFRRKVRGDGPSGSVKKG